MQPRSLFAAQQRPQGLEFGSAKSSSACFGILSPENDRADAECDRHVAAIAQQDIHARSSSSDAMGFYVVDQEIVGQDLAMAREESGEDSPALRAYDSHNYLPTTCS
ncbi:hypothetical protein CERZMDRAFT_101024 [Cercospora zeae-maydis SCOH1-5]|uniref:Uncharacterized protein n=1 Tax=Cercospora zeae-maydis SCOH1-5 TaxID=717836 RepID=A0A6A6F667_9PEZI|nr:hypothetical protein CERZMDRAFT_101024 [Cercospora zeae-maydis SCOH1-5]